MVNYHITLSGAVAPTFFYLLKPVVQFSFFFFFLNSATSSFFFLLIEKYVVETNLELHKSIMLNRKKEQIVPLICIMDKI